MVTLTRFRCQNCGLRMIFPDDEGRPRCVACGRSFNIRAYYGQFGGMQTKRRYGSGYYSELSKSYDHSKSRRGK